MLNIIYQQQVSYVPSDGESMNDNDSESSDTLTNYQLVTTRIAIIRTIYAKLIWREWRRERLWGPRVGVILISTMEEGAEKVLLISYISDKPFQCLNFGFPKGKPNLGETIKHGGFREMVEEIGINDPYDSIRVAIKYGVVIKKCPYIGSRDQRRSRTHYYVIATTFSQDATFQPDKTEVCNVQWHSIYTLPCCDTCKIKWRFTPDDDPKIPVNYHMVTLRDINGENSAVLDILAYVDEKNGNRNAYNKYVYTHRKCKGNFS
ncbi:unnamed protein product [Rotaria sp. Silwood2]|nr:unnamed protein product [Rotaria sp. Silwood2]